VIRTLKEPNSWDDLNRLLWQKSFDSQTNKYRPYIAFRGLSRTYTKDLVTGIQRISRLRPLNLATLERRLLDTFRNYAQEHYPELRSDWELLSLGRHYRLHTRLIDWTISPYVALFFATENMEHWNRDGVVWCVSRKKTRDVLPAKLRRILEEKGTYLFSASLLQKKYADLARLDNDKDLKETMIWFEPASISPRIVNQYALFSVMPGVESCQFKYFERNPGLAWRIPIPKRLKPEIYQRLEVMNLSHRTIYPGLDGIALWLNGYYA